MDTMECIRSRRSVRHFTEEPVSRDLLDKLAEAVMWSPSWANTQCWELIILTEKDRIAEIAQTVRPTNPAAKGLTEAPAVFAICAKTGRAGFKKGEPSTDKGDWYMLDAGIAVQNLCLAAHDEGLGTVIVGSLDHKKADEILGLPEDIKTLVLIPVGRPAAVPSAPKRKKPEEFVHYERYRP